MHLLAVEVYCYCWPFVLRPRYVGLVCRFYCFSRSAMSISTLIPSGWLLSGLIGPFSMPKPDSNQSILIFHVEFCIASKQFRRHPLKNMPWLLVFVGVFPRLKQNFQDSLLIFGKHFVKFCRSDAKTFDNINEERVDSSQLRLENVPSKRQTF